ncbi:GMC family oxidoreductase N-terminal domain-containing protein [Streptomyces canus]|uniref:GMC family oxidoreductase N-terminal domain-containing protein n=1 Tax=Streptomyces canus TaxID=58343 RepID=UPI0036B98477
MDEEGHRCTGVEYGVDGPVSTLRAAREVVLTTGAVGSAQLLLRSGIGSECELRKAGVEGFHDLPGVGRNRSRGVRTRTARPPPRRRRSRASAARAWPALPERLLPDRAKRITTVTPAAWPAPR